MLPEYYPTRTELGILCDRASEIAAIIPEGAALVEFGAGATTKVRLLLEQATMAMLTYVEDQADGLLLEFIRESPTWSSAACLCHCGHRTHLSGDVTKPTMKWPTVSST